MNERHEQRLLDASVLIDLERRSEETLPRHSAIAAITFAELAGGLHTAPDAIERSARAMRLQMVEASFNPLPFDVDAARRYGQLIATVIAAGQNPRPRRMDLLIAATALANDLPLYTRNASDFRALTSAMTIVGL